MGKSKLGKFSQPRRHPLVRIKNRMESMLESCAGDYSTKKNEIRLYVTTKMIWPDGTIIDFSEADREEMAVKVLMHELEHYHDLMMIPQGIIENLDHSLPNLVEKIAFEISGTP